MGGVIGQLLPLAVGIAVSPLPIVAVVLMLATPRGRVNGPAFVVAWIAGLGGVTTLVVVLAGDDATDGGGAPATWVSWLKLLLGLGLLGVGAAQFRRRPHGGTEASLPGWMAALDSFTAVKAAGTGLLLSAVNPKNLLLAVAGGAVIAQAGVSAGSEAGAIAVFVLIGTLGVAAPVVLAVALGERSRAILDGLRQWLARNNAVIMATLLLVIGVKLIGDAISGFA